LDIREKLERAGKNECRHGGFRGKSPTIMRFGTQIVVVIATACATCVAWGVTDDYSTDFDDWSEQTSWGTYTNAGWIAKESKIRGGTYAPNSDPYACWLDDHEEGQGHDPWLRSPLLTNGVGIVYFAQSCKTTAGDDIVFTVESSTDNTNWTVHATFTNDASDALWRTNECALNTFTGLYVRIHSTTNGSHVNGQYLGLDDISITAPEPFVAIAGAQSTNMILVASNLYQGVITPANALTNPAFYIVSPMESWGDDDQAITNLPVRGTGGVDEANIIVSGTVTNNLAFLFNTADFEYSIRNCSYANFDAWTNGTTASYGTYTNDDAWIISVGRINKNDAGENERALAGKFGILNHEYGGTQYLRSPRLTNGIGTVSFSYRNWENDGSPAAEFIVQKSVDGSNDWLNINAGAVVTNIVSTNYLYFSANVADRGHQYVRILNKIDSVDSWLCLDEVVITEPGASVELSGPGRSPDDPAIGDFVNVSINATPDGGATNLACSVYVRSESFADFVSFSMTNSGSVFSARIPPTHAGNVDYYFRCAYEGYDASPTHYPPGAPVQCLVYTNSEISTRWQDFDDWSEQTSWGTYTNAGWIANESKIRGGTYAPNSEPYACWLDDHEEGQGHDPWLRSPLLTNGVGTVYFAQRCKTTGGDIVFTVESSTDTTNWSVLATFTNYANEAVWTTNRHVVNTYQDIYIRIHSTTNGSSENGQYLGLDDVAVSFPPADAIVTNVVYSPGYPSTSDPVTVSCEMFSVYSNFPSFNFMPRICHRMGSGSWQTNDMTALGSNYVGIIPPYPRGEVSYYVRGDFDGFYYTYGEFSDNQSPAFWPQATPETPAAYEVRAYLSEYDHLSVTSNVGSATMELVGDTYWQGILEISRDTNQIAASFAGFGRYTEEDGYSTETNFWGDDNQARFTAPQAGVGETNGAVIVVNGQFEGTNQFLFRYNPVDNTYLITRCAYQNFNKWDASSDYFEESLNLVGITGITNDFNDWPVSHTYVTQPGQDLEEFESWPVTNIYYLDPASVGSNGWRIEEAMIVEESDGNQACHFLEDSNDGAVWPHRATSTRGLETFNFRYRCVQQDHYHTWYDQGTDWNNYVVEASLRTTERSPEHPYLSILGRYQNESNYYELRLQEFPFEGGNRLRASIWRRKNGSYEEIDYYGPFSGSLATTHACKLVVVTNNSNYVYLEGYIDGELRMDGTASFDTGAGRIHDPGSIGFRAVNTDIVVTNVSVKHTDIQRFENATQGTYGNYTLNRWVVSNGWPTANYCILTSNTGANVTSPQLDYDPGQVTFRYYAYEPGPILHVLASSNHTDWVTNSVLSGFATNTWYEGQLTGDLTPHHYFRFLNASSGSRIIIDDIYVTEAAAFYSENFSSGTATNWNAPHGYWYVDVGDKTYNKSSGYLGPQIGFDVATALTNGTVPYGEGADWTNVASFTADNLTYRSTNVVLRYWDNLLVKIRHTDGDAGLVVDDLSMSSWRGTNYTGSNGWTATGVWVAEREPADNCGEFWRSRADPSLEQYLTTPYMGNGAGTITFDYSATNLPVEFKIRKAVGPLSNDFFDVETVAVSNSGWNNYSLSITSSTQMFLRVSHTSTNNNLAVLRLDNVRVNDYAERTPSMWEAYNARITYNLDEREFEPYNEPESEFKTCFLNNSATGGTHAGVTLDIDKPYVQSPLLTKGIGEISFWYRNWETDGEPGSTIYLRSAVTRTNAPEDWNEIGVISGITNTSYRYFATNYYITTNYFLRLYCDTNMPAARLCLDNVLITEPVGADLDIDSVTVIPQIPLHTNPVRLSADLTGFLLSPSNIEVWTCYYIGTNEWGNWPDTNWIPMDAVTTNGAVLSYTSTSSIPTYLVGIDTVVQYHVWYSFDGQFAEHASPKIHTDFFTNPPWYYPVDLNAGRAYTNPYYFVFSCLPGQAWINELNIIDDAYHPAAYMQYVELCGWTGINISNWWIDVYNNSFQKTGHYPVTNDATIANHTNQYGFWVLGDTNTPGRNATLTNTLPTIGGIHLRRSMGAYEHAVCYDTWDGQGGKNMTNDPSYRFVYIGYDDDWEDVTLSLTGTGSNKYDFAWVNTATDYNPGSINVNQTLVQRNVPILSIDITDLFMTDTNALIGFTSTCTGDWVHTLFSSTNLTDTNSWYALTNNPAPVSPDVTNWFTVPLETSSPSYYYQVTATNGP